MIPFIHAIYILYDMYLYMYEYICILYIYVYGTFYVYCICMRIFIYIYANHHEPCRLSKNSRLGCPSICEPCRPSKNSRLGSLSICAGVPHLIIGGEELNSLHVTLDPRCLPDNRAHVLGLRFGQDGI